jgi:hypothetical protein
MLSICPSARRTGIHSFDQWTMSCFEASGSLLTHVHHFTTGVVLAAPTDLAIHTGNEPARSRGPSFEPVPNRPPGPVLGGVITL